ncbi:16S rRNA (cytidine(1402)-2'-O)-methyltransferase [bacterium]|nr:16S rRNA (cytidine(1402)-2'-O)-methyltransferase [bacterium]
MLYIVATPIGNLKDITLRALEIFKKVDLIACEDTRVAKKLLNHYDIKTSLISYHQHSKTTRIDYLIDKLKKGQNIALVTDAGTPGISDPGGKLIEEAVKNDIEVIPVPGVSALPALISVAGINLQKFVFLGFPPHKKGRETFFKEAKKSNLPVIFFESRYRIFKALKTLENSQVIVGRELTKMHEEIIRGSAEEVLEYFENNPEKVRGEFAVIVKGVKQ